MSGVCCAPLEALSDSRARLSSSVPALNSRMSQHLTERCCRFLKSAAEVPRLYRRTNKVGAGGEGGARRPDSNSASLNRKFQRVHRPTWTTPYSLYISC